MLPSFACGSAPVSLDPLGDEKLQQSDTEMDDRTRFRLAEYVSIAIGFVWLLLLVGAAFVMIGGVRALRAGNSFHLLMALLGEAAIYGVWAGSTYVLARLLTNNTEGYRPWQWGMVPRTEHGKSAQEFNIPLSYAEAKDHFTQPSAVSG